MGFWSWPRPLVHLKESRVRFFSAIEVAALISRRGLINFLFRWLKSWLCASTH